MRHPRRTGAVVRARPIGALHMEDEKGVDEKIIVVPIDRLHPYYKRVGSYRDLPEILIEQIGHFFEHYKDLEQGKWVKVLRWAEPPEAIELIRAASSARKRKAWRRPRICATCFAVTERLTEKPAADPAAQEAKDSAKAKRQLAQAVGKLIALVLVAW